MMIKFLLLSAIVGIAICSPLPQLLSKDDFSSGRGEGPMNDVKIHSGYASIRRQGRMHGFSGNRFFRVKDPRELAGGNFGLTNSVISPLPERAPVFMGFTDEELKKHEELKAKIEAASKKAVAASEKKKEEQNIIEEEKKEEIKEKVFAEAAEDLEKIKESLEEKVENIQENIEQVKEEIKQDVEKIEKEIIQNIASSETTTMMVEEAEEVTTTVQSVINTTSTEEEEEEVTTTITSALLKDEETEKSPSMDIDLGSVQEVL